MRIPVVLMTAMLCLALRIPAAELTGKYAPTATPALPPEAATRSFVVPDGFEMRLFASEPMVVNPVAMHWDARGRLWVVELLEYPLGAAKGTPPRDQVKILEDTDHDGRADKVTVFAKGLNLATGIACGHDGAYIGQAPHLYFMKDTNGDDVADEKRIVLTGFGLEDRHELLNGFTWGPDGQLYMTHGVFTHSKVRIPDGDDDGVVMNAAVARVDPLRRSFEVFADGTSNPWGVDFDRHGNAFVSACVIDHLFHMAPGGQYLRQGGIWANPFGYAGENPRNSGLPSIVDHRHHLAAYSGVQVYQGHQYPDDYSGTIVMGNIHDNSVHQDILERNGSSFKASFGQDLIRSKDGWFRPVSQQVGPDGALWIMDWYDKYPCYQNARNNPEGVDREYGRIWRLVHVGDQPGKAVPPRDDPNMDFARLSTEGLVRLLAHPNIWHRETALRLLNERKDASAGPSLRQLMASSTLLEGRLFAFWALYGSGLLEDSLLDQAARDGEFGMRLWAARFTGERQQWSPRTEQRLLALAADPDPSVRLAVAVALRQFSSGSLTVNTPAPVPADQVDPGAILTTLIQHSAKGNDPTLAFLIWTAAEPWIALNPEPALRWLIGEGSSTRPLSEELAYKLMRRISDLRSAERLDQALQAVETLARAEAPLASRALDGLVEGAKGNPARPGQPGSVILEALLTHPEKSVQDKARQLGSTWGSAGALMATLKEMLNPGNPIAKRVEALEAATRQRSDAALEGLRSLIDSAAPESLRMTAIQALGRIGTDEEGNWVLERWASWPWSLRQAAALVMTTRHRWSSSLLGALERGDIVPADIPAPAIRVLTSSKQDFGMLAKRANKVFGRVREADRDKSKIITAKRNMILQAKKEPDLKAGHELAQKVCFTCHKLHGEGADVGPDLTGAGRSSLESLLSNIIDPNQIIGNGYENVEVETRDGRVLSGRLVESNETRVRLLSAGPREEIIARADIVTFHVGELSVMPEGLEQMPDEDFRNLIAFLLNPPQDAQPFSWKVLEDPETLPAKRSGAQAPLLQDGESIALWAPRWHLTVPSGEGSPVRLPEHLGRKNVLSLQAFADGRPAVLESEWQNPSSHPMSLRLEVAAEPESPWLLVARVNGREVLRRKITGQPGPTWQEIRIPVASTQGETAQVRIEQHQVGLSPRRGFWRPPVLDSESVARR